MGNAFWSFFKAYYEEIENSPSKMFVLVSNSIKNNFQI